MNTYRHSNKALLRGEALTTCPPPTSLPPGTNHYPITSPIVGVFEVVTDGFATSPLGAEEFALEM